MLIYKDIFTGDEVCSDSFPMKVVDGVILEFTGQYCVRKDGEVTLAGANASAEGEEDEGVEDATAQRGIDIVLNHNLVEMAFYADLKNFKTYIKEYMKKVAEHMKKQGVKEEEQTEWKSKMQKWVVDVLKKDRFQNLVFYVGDKVSEGEAEGGQVIICEYRDFDGVEKPILMYIKAGLEEEKQ